MSVAQSASASDTGIYRFAGVEFDQRRQVLLVDGAEIAAKPLTLRLLRLLCEADGRVLSRDELFASLWPGGQEISDAALSQQIWRLRTALGPYAALLITLRRNGVRLDAVVTVERALAAAAVLPSADAEPAAATGYASAVPAQVMPGDTSPASDVSSSSPALSPSSSSAPAPEAAANPSDSRSGTEGTAAAIRPGSRLRRTGLIVLTLALVLLAALALWRRDPLVNDGYGLHVSDLQASRPETPRQISTALNAALAGDRAQAVAIMRNLHDSDARTPLPALMLGLWLAGDDAAAARSWLDQARARLTPQASPYLRLFVDYLTARALRQPVAGQVDALLDLRPSAWLLQHTRSHAALARRDFVTALQALRAIPLHIGDTSLLADVLADRVSLGDGEAEAAAWTVAALREDAVLAPYLRARFAWSHGTAAQAAPLFQDCVDAAAATPRTNDMRQACARYAALAAAEAGSADAVRLADAAARLAHELGYFAQESQLWGLEAFLAARAGQADAAGEALVQAWRGTATPLDRAPLLLLALQNGLTVPAPVEPVADDLPVEPIFGGVRQLLLAWTAWSRGDRTEAGRQLDLAVERGIARTWHAEDAALLAAQLGREAAPCRLDPPYPNPLRLTACIRLRELKNKLEQ